MYLATMSAYDFDVSAKSFNDSITEGKRLQALVATQDAELTKLKAVNDDSVIRIDKLEAAAIVAAKTISDQATYIATHVATIAKLEKAAADNADLQDKIDKIAKLEKANKNWEANCVAAETNCDAAEKELGELKFVCRVRDLVGRKLVFERNLEFLATAKELGYFATDCVCLDSGDIDVDATASNLLKAGFKEADAKK